MNTVVPTHNTNIPTIMTKIPTLVSKMPTINTILPTLSTSSNENIQTTTNYIGTKNNKIRKSENNTLLIVVIIGVTAILSCICILLLFAIRFVKKKSDKIKKMEKQLQTLQSMQSVPPIQHYNNSNRLQMVNNDSKEHFVDGNIASNAIHINIEGADNDSIDNNQRKGTVSAVGEILYDSDKEIDNEINNLDKIIQQNGSSYHRSVQVINQESMDTIIQQYLSENQEYIHRYTKGEIDQKDINTSK